MKDQIQAQAAETTTAAADRAPASESTAPATVQREAARGQSAELLQLKGEGPTQTRQVQQIAAEGVKGGGGALPHQEAIQASFGGHDVSGVKAHTGVQAKEASGKIGAEAYATGDNVAFAGSPGLHTAAHEAAHVVQQRAGVQLKGGVGEVGDKYEKHADAVADRVVQGKSAEDLLDGMAGPARQPEVQRKAAVQRKPKKSVSSKAAKRVSAAEKAIKHTKSVMAFGAGNQKEALEATKFNSYYRMKVMRDPACWIMADSVKGIAAANPEALTAAKADLAKGGNCGEHAQVAFDYLRVNLAGDTINRASVNGLDHAFVLIGDVASEGDADIGVSDPWPTKATATVWEDHFAYTSDRKAINLRTTLTADGKNMKAVIAAGLKLSPRGQQMIQQKMSEGDTKKNVKDGLGGWVWQHEDAAAQGSDYEYQGPQPAGP